MPSDVQDALVTILSEKSMPVPELNSEVAAARGFNVIATANDRDRGVNDLSSALRRRFNTVVLPLPETAEEEIAIVAQRVDELGAALALPPIAPAADEIRRVVTVFRELRDGVTADGGTSLKVPSGTLSTAEAISVVTNGLALAAHFGDGSLSADDVAAGIVGAVVRDPVPRRRRLARVPRGGRRRARRLGRLLRRLPGTRLSVRLRHDAAPARDPPPRPGVGALGCACARRAAAVDRAGRVAGRATHGVPLGRRRRVSTRRSRCSATSSTSRGGRCSRRSPSFSPEWQAVRWANEHGVPVEAIDLPLANSLAVGDDDDRLIAGDGTARPARCPRRGRRRARRRALVGGRHRAPRRRSAGVRRGRRGDGGGAFGHVAVAVRRSAARRTCASASAPRISDGHATVVVVCGAWHVPALDSTRRRPPTAAATTPRCAACRRSRWRSAGCRGPTRGSADGERVRRRRRAARAGTTTCSGIPGADGVARFFVDAARVLRARRHAGLARPPDRGDPHGRHAGHDARPAAAGSRRGARRRRHRDGRAPARAPAAGGRRARSARCPTARRRCRSPAISPSTNARHGSSPRPRTARSSSTCARPTACAGRTCCTGSPRSACRGVRSRTDGGAAARSARRGGWRGGPSGRFA